MGLFPNLEALGRRFFSAGGGFSPHAEVSLASEQASLKSSPGDGELVVSRLSLAPKPGWNEGQYFFGEFEARFAAPPGTKGGPNLQIEATIAGKLSGAEILENLADHINERTPYGASVHEGVLEILGPTSIKGPKPARGVEQVFGDSYVGATS